MNARYSRYYCLLITGLLWWGGTRAAAPQTPAERRSDTPNAPALIFPGVQESDYVVDSGNRYILSLNDCLRQAIESNYSVTIARNREKIAKNNLTPAPFLPSLTLGGDQEQERLKTRGVYPSASELPDVKNDYTTNTYSADLGLNWRLFDGLSMFAAYDTKKELLSQGELSLKKSMEDLAADIAGQYYYIVTQENRLRATKAYLEISTLRYTQAMEKYIIGAISGLEMKQAKIDLNADSSKLVLQQEIILNAYVQLFEMMNIDLGTEAVLSDTIAPNGYLSLGVIRENARVHNTDIQLARSGQRVSGLDLKIARASRYPAIDFNAGYRFDHNGGGLQATRFNQLHGPSWGFSASVPLFNRLETNRKIRNAKIEVENSELVCRETELTVESRIIQIYNTYRKNFLMIGFEQESADVASANLDAAMEMYRLGTMSGVEFREIQRSYIEAVERMLDAVYQAKLSEINLRYLSGQILN